MTVPPFATRNTIRLYFIQKEGVFQAVSWLEAIFGGKHTFYETIL